MNSTYKIVYLDGDEEYISNVEAISFEPGVIIFDQLWKTEVRKIELIRYIEVDSASNM